TTTDDGILRTCIGGWAEKIAMGQADSQGFDSSGLTPEEIVHSVPQTSAAQGLHDRVPPALTVFSMIISPAHSVSDPSSPGSLPIHWLYLPPRDAATATPGILPPAVLDARSPPIAYGRSESGGGDDAILRIDGEVPEEAASL